MEKGRGVSMKKWALLSLQHIPRQEETAPLQAELSGARGVEERCFAILFLFSRLKSQMLGSPSGFSVPCSQGMLRGGEGRGLQCLHGAGKGEALHREK